MTDTPVCCSCGQPAVYELLVIPRRTTAPLCDHVTRALAWPGAAEPTTLYACGAVDHRKAIREAASVVLSARTLGRDVVSRVVKEETR